MSNCGGTKNQTDDKSFEILKTNFESLGTGVFLIPAPDFGVLEWKKVLVQSIQYKEAIKRGENCTAFKWIPDALMDFKNVQESLLRCRDFWCGNDRTWCPGACFCGDGNYCF